MKRLLSFLLLCLLLAGCAAKVPALPEPPAPEALAKELLDAGVFSDTLEPVSVGVGSTLYGLGDNEGESRYFWFSSGATAEELAIFVCADDAAAAAVRKAAQARLEHQSAAFANYVPAEVPKLNAALLRSRDRYVVLCVAADAQKAAELLGRYFSA